MSNEPGSSARRRDALGDRSERRALFAWIPTYAGTADARAELPVHP
jgi:hypothetical protein